MRPKPQHLKSAAEKAEEAKAMALQCAEHRNIPINRVRRAIDTAFVHRPPCFVIQESETKALVVYEESPESLNELRMYRGRLVSA